MNTSSAFFIQTSIRNSSISFSTIALLLISSFWRCCVLNPGPVKYPCGLCGGTVWSYDRGIYCDQCDVWYLGCAKKLSSSSSESWMCNGCLVEPQQRHQGYGKCHRAGQNNHRGKCCDHCNNYLVLYKMC